MKAKLKIEDNKLIIEGFQINVDGNIELECSEEDLEKLIEKKLAKPKKTGYERATNKEVITLIDKLGRLDRGYIANNQTTDLAYENANYYTSDVVATNNARADKLMRQLRRFAVEHREKELGWDHYGLCTKKYCICYRYDEGRVICTYDQHIRVPFEAYFDSEDSCKLAIDTFHDELIWYFTEYKDSL